MSHKGGFFKSAAIRAGVIPTHRQLIWSPNLEAVEAVHGGAREENLVPGHGFACV